MNDARFRLYHEIIELYKEHYTQKDISNKLEIPVEIISQVTQMGDFTYTRQKHPDNLRDGEFMTPIILGEQLSFLDPYIK